MVKNCCFEQASGFFFKKSPSFSSSNCNQYGIMQACHEYEYNFNKQVKISVAV